MGMLKGASFPLQYLSDLRRSSLLPFLYHTRTLIPSSPAKSLCFKRRALLRNRGSRFFSSSRRLQGSRETAPQGSSFVQQGSYRPPRSSSAWSTASAQNSSHRKTTSLWSPLSSDSGRIHEPSQQDAGRPPRSQSVFDDTGGERKSTLTASEQAAFDRIFSEISQKSRDERLEPEEDEYWEENDLEETSEEIEGMHGSPRDQLAAIFEDAIEGMKERDDRLPQDDLDQGSIPNEDPYTKDASLSKDRHGPTTDTSFRPVVIKQAESHEEDEVHLKRACKDHRTLVNSLLESATTDTEIWNILEKEVFSLMVQLNLQMKHEEKARKAELRAQKKAAKAAKTTATTDIASNSQTFNSTKTPTRKRKVSGNESKALTTTTLLAILQSNYAHHIVLALRRFRHLNLSSTYTMSFFPRLKDLGPISYVLGASTDLYNEILFQKWIQSSDVQGIADLMEEMVNHGIAPNVTTVEFVRFVRRSRRRQVAGDSDPVKKTWWSSQPVREGWNKIMHFYRRFLPEVAQTTANEERLAANREQLQRIRASKRGPEPIRRVMVDSEEPWRVRTPLRETKEGIAEGNETPRLRTSFGSVATAAAAAATARRAQGGGDADESEDIEQELFDETEPHSNSKGAKLTVDDSPLPRGDAKPMKSSLRDWE